MLLTTLALTGWSWRAAVRSTEAIAQLNFQRQIEILEHRIADRLSDCEHVLLGGAGLVEVKGTVSRGDWHDYFTAIRVEEKLAGVQGLGFSLCIPAAALAAHVQAVRSEGFLNYAVRPADPREEYHSIIYLEPFRDRNLRAFGYDMFTEPVRREAMEKARDEGRTIMSGRVTLVQEIPGQPTQAGFLIYMPVYLHGVPRQTIPERRDALHGFVYSPFRAGDFIDRLFFLEPHGLAMEIRTGRQGQSPDLLYASTERPRSETIPAGFEPRYRATSRIDPLGQQWTLTFTSLPSFEATQPRGTAKVTLAGGLIISLLATALMFGLNDRSRQLAELSRTSADLQRSGVELERRVAQRTTELELSLSRFRVLLQVASDGIHVLDAQGNLQEYSESFRRMLGYEASEMAARHVTDWDAQIPQATIAEILRNPLGAEMVFETQHRRKDGTVFPVEINARVIELAGQQRFYASARDVTLRIREQRKLQELLKQTEQDAQTKGELLREVNHRVTNNLTAVLGLLAFETEQARNDPAAINRALLRLGQHIRGLLQVHRILSQSAWAPVSLDRLAGDIIRAALSAAPWRQQAVISLPAGALKVSPRQAGTLAMIINELATNTVKHICHPIDAVRINFAAESDPEWITLHYQDNGPGYPPEVVENQRTNVGLKLIRELVTQTLRGTLTLANDHGAVATLRIRKEEETRT